MNRALASQRLTPAEIRTRASTILGLTIVLLALGLIAPGSLPAWFPLATSCGAITGLPCIFCGATRAVHQLLNGDFRSALYYNWLAFPLVAAALSLIFLHIAELFAGRRLIAHWSKVRLSLAKLCAVFTALVLLWCLQVYLAVSQHKHELLNPHGPLYSLVVR